MENKKTTASRGHSRKHAAPPALKLLIEVVNALPEGMPNTEAIKQEARQSGQDFDRLFSEKLSRMPELAQKFVGTYPLAKPTSQVEHLLPQLPDWMVKRIGGRIQVRGLIFFASQPGFLTQSQMESLTTNNAAKEYLQYRDDEAMSSIDRQQARLRYDYMVEGKDMLANIADVDLREFPYEFHGTAWITTDENGKLFVTTTIAWLQQVIGGIEAKRIHACPICEKIYWAERSDQPTCSERCNNIRRSRIQRGTYTETRETFLSKTKVKK